MNLFNTTKDVIEDRYSKFSYVIPPESTLSVADDCGRHLLKRQERNGLVSLDYGMEEEEKYGSLKKYQESKRSLGLKRYRDSIKDRLNQEMVFPREVTAKNGGEVEMASTNIPYFKNKLKEIDSLIEKATEIKPETKEVPQKRGRGRPKKVAA